jgi:hypothetical protein
MTADQDPERTVLYSVQGLFFGGWSRGFSTLFRLKPQPYTKLK